MPLVNIKVGLDQIWLIVFKKILRHEFHWGFRVYKYLVVRTNNRESITFSRSGDRISILLKLSQSKNTTSPLPGKQRGFPENKASDVFVLLSRYFCSTHCYPMALNLKDTVNLNTVIAWCFGDWVNMGLFKSLNCEANREGSCSQ